jgi:hypothetical protein
MKHNEDRAPKLINSLAVHWKWVGFLRQTVMGVILTVGPCGFSPKHVKTKARRPEIPFPRFSQVFWFLFWFDGDLIHFQTTIPNRVETADSPETIDSIDVLQREKEVRDGARGGS